LEKGDHFIVETAAGVFTYEIKNIKIVGANDKSIIVPTDQPVLTVTTCYPFNYIGDAPQRYILISDLIQIELK
jgi:sortase A